MVATMKYTHKHTPYTYENTYTYTPIHKTKAKLSAVVKVVTVYW